MPPKKKRNFAKHASRVGNRVRDRAVNFVASARSGTYDQTQLARDIGGSIMDMVDFWGSLFGSGASPATPLVRLGPKTSAQWKNAGDTRTVLLDEAVPDDALWPVGGAGNPPLLKLRPVDGGAAVNLDLMAVNVVDDESLELSITVLGTGGPAIPAGEYFGNLYYESASLGAGQHFAAMIRAQVT